MSEGRKTGFERLISTIEIVSGAFLLVIAGLTFVSALLRYVFSSPIPDSFEISRQLLGVTMCWGIACAFNEKAHIQLDLFWNFMSDRVKKATELVGTVITLFAMSVFTWRLLLKVIDGFHTKASSVDLGLQLWIFHAVAWIGIVASVITILFQIISLLKRSTCPAHVKDQEEI